MQDRRIVIPRQHKMIQNVAVFLSCLSCYGICSVTITLPIYHYSRFLSNNLRQISLPFTTLLNGWKSFASSLCSNADFQHRCFFCITWQYSYTVDTLAYYTIILKFHYRTFYFVNVRRGSPRSFKLVTVLPVRGQTDQFIICRFCLIILLCSDFICLQVCFQSYFFSVSWIPCFFVSSQVTKI